MKGYRHGTNAPPSHTDSAPAQGPLTPMKLTPTTTPGQHKQREPSELFQSDLFLLNTQIVQGGIQGYCV